MTSPSTSLRKHLQTRTTKTLIQAGAKIGRLTDAQKKTPSQKKSESARKKDLKRAGLTIVATGTLDCHTCHKRAAGCVLKPDECKERTIVEKCKGCHAWVRHYVDNANPWVLCPACEERK